MNMHIKVTATEANRSFSRLLQEVRKGNRVTITSHGQPLATLAPAENEEERKAQEAREALGYPETYHDRSLDPRRTLRARLSQSLAGIRYQHPRLCGWSTADRFGRAQDCARGRAVPGAGRTRASYSAGTGPCRTSSSPAPKGGNDIG